MYVELHNAPGELRPTGTDAGTAKKRALWAVSSSGLLEGICMMSTPLGGLPREAHEGQSTIEQSQPHTRIWVRFGLFEDIAEDAVLYDPRLRELHALQLFQNGIDTKLLYGRQNLVAFRHRVRFLVEEETTDDALSHSSYSFLLQLQDRVLAQVEARFRFDLNLFDAG